MARITSGVEAMKLISQGVYQQVPTETLEKVRTYVSMACEEIVDCGARIRPLRVDNKQIGWVRGIHLSEKKVLHRWLSDPTDLLMETLLLGTTLTREQITDLSSLEVRSLALLLNRMQEYDLSVYPYLNAFSTTMTSEKLWHSKGRTLSSYSNRRVELPNGASIKILAPPDHASIWATMCTYREDNKLRVENTMNALMITRAFVGSKATHSLTEELRKVSLSLKPDNIEPWQKVVRPESSMVKDDGWAHGGGDTVEDLLREMKGIESNDKHEQLMAKFEAQQRAEAEAEKKRIEDLLRKYHKDEDIWEESVPVILTNEEVRARELELKRSRSMVKPIVPHDDDNPRDKMRRFDH